ncbi:MAG: acyloxyacyl hydrolase, partial [Proteobacteria bacterium]|nr:acyloxyacyl hydrolase [Pseudomonadota bacterium]
LRQVQTIHAVSRQAFDFCFENRLYRLAVVNGDFYSYTFTAGQEMRPYLFGGGGPVYSFADIPGMGAELNGNYQFGIGLEYETSPSHNLLFELRYHHISNAGSDEPNDPLNSCKLLFGITF